MGEGSCSSFLFDIASAGAKVMITLYIYSVQKDVSATDVSSPPKPCDAPIVATLSERVKQHPLYLMA